MNDLSEIVIDLSEDDTIVNNEGDVKRKKKSTAIVEVVEYPEPQTKLQRLFD